MGTASLPRLILFTLAVLAGGAAILTDRFFVPGIFLIGFSSIILMTKREQKTYWSTPLTKWQIVRGFMPLVLVVACIALLLIADQIGLAPSESALIPISGVFKIVFVIAAVFMIAQPWLQWYKARDNAHESNSSD